MEAIRVFDAGRQLATTADDPPEWLHVSSALIAISLHVK